MRKFIKISVIISFFICAIRVFADNGKDCKYTFWEKPYIHPKIIQDLHTWLSDGGDQVVAINLIDSQDSNRYSEEIKIRKIPGGHPFIYTEDEENGMFGYQYIGKTSSGIYILYISENGGGSGVFKNLMLVTIEKDKGAYFDESSLKITNSRERLIIKKLGEISLGDRWNGDLKVEGNKLIIGKDVGWFSQQRKNKNKYPKGRVITIDIK